MHPMITALGGGALLFLLGAVAGRGLAALIRSLALDGGFASSRYYSLASGWAGSLPVVGHWLAPRGARCPRLALIELACGGASLACWELFPAGKAVCGALFFFALIGAFFIDLDHMIIPDLFTIGLAVVGLIASFLCPSLHGFAEYSAWTCLRSGAAGLLGLALGSALVLWIGLIGETLLGREVLGFGDVKFLGAIGAFCGWQGAVFALFGGAALAALSLVIGALRAALGRTGPALPGAGPRRQMGRLGIGQPFPFGPMLAGAAGLYFLGLGRVVDPFLDQYRALF